MRQSPTTTYYLGLFIAPLGTPSPIGAFGGIDDPNWQFVVAYTMNSTAAAGAGRMLNPGVATVPGYAPGTNVNFIVRVWQSSSDHAVWPDTNLYRLSLGVSALGTATLGGGPIPTPNAFGTGPGQIGGLTLCA